MDTVCPSMVGPLTRIWNALHTDLRVTIAPADASYLRRIVLVGDDHLIAHLIAEKLQKSFQAPHQTSTSSARIGSLVRYSVNGRRFRGRIVHGQQTGAGSLGAGSRYGSALVGVHEGQSLLWPTRSGQLIELCVDEVEHPLVAHDVSVTTYSEAKSLCAFG